MNLITSLGGGSWDDDETPGTVYCQVLLIHFFALYLRKAAKCEYKHVSGSLGDDEFVDSLGFVIFFSVRVCSLE